MTGRLGPGGTREISPAPSAGTIGPVGFRPVGTVETPFLPRVTPCGDLPISRNIVIFLSVRNWYEKLPMNSKPKVPCIPIEGSISWEDWLKGRRTRRETSKLVAPGVIRRKTSSSDRRLKKLFNGERGLPFTPTEKL